MFPGTLPENVGAKVVYEVVKGWLTGSDPDLGEMYHLGEPHRPAGAEKSA